MVMKKKILRIVSSILGVFAICGLSLFSVLEHKKDTQKVSATMLDVQSPVQIGDGHFNSEYIYTENVMYNGVLTTFRCVWEFDLNCTYRIDFKQSTSEYRYTFIGNKNLTDNYIRTYKQYGNEPIFDVYTLKIGGSRTSLYFQTDFVSDLDLTNAFVYITSILVSSDGTFTLYGRINNQYNTTYSGLTFLDVNNNSNVTNLLSFFPSNYKLIDFTDYLDSFSSNSNIADTYYDIGYDSGYSTGYSEGYENGVYDTSIRPSGESYEQGYADGYAEGTAYSEVASDVIYDMGYADGASSQYTVIAQSYQEGYSAGLSEGLNSDATVATIFSNILLVGMLPVDFFLRILNWEFLGINIASFVSALLSVAATIIVIRFVTGKKE